MPLTFGSLFAGIGGLDLGLERAGLRCSWQVEKNPFCRRVLAKHWPDVRRHDDVRTFSDGRNPDEWRVDVVAGGFPCKQTSAAAAVHGRRVGLAGKDSGLWAHMLDVIGWLAPRFALVENPPSRWLAAVSEGLAGLGYRVSGLPLTASGAGAPHLRRRVFLIANRDGAGLEIAGTPGSPPAVGDEGGAVAGNPWLSTLPGVLRVDDGIPGRVDRRERIQAVGNAVVPAAAERVGRLLVRAL